MRQSNQIRCNPPQSPPPPNETPLLFIPHPRNPFILLSLPLTCIRRSERSRYESSDRRCKHNTTLLLSGNQLLQKMVGNDKACGGIALYIGKQPAKVKRQRTMVRRSSGYTTPSQNKYQISRLRLTLVGVFDRRTQLQ